jgi:hypothetical protein
VPQLLWHGDRIQRARRDDSQRESFCELDPEVKDKWGIPVLRFHWQWGENERKMAVDMQETFRSIMEAGGGTVIAGTRRHPKPQSEMQQQAPLRISQGRRDHS